MGRMRHGSKVSTSVARTTLAGHHGRSRATSAAPPVTGDSRHGLTRLRAFTLIELLIVVSIIVALIGILLPALGASRHTAQRVICGSNLRQMTTALLTYLGDNRDSMFPACEAIAGQGDLWWFGFEAQGGPAAEGQRILDRKRGRLFRYYEDPDSVEICPSFALASPKYKPKFTTNWTTYGAAEKFMNNVGGPIKLRQLIDPARSLALGDSAQLNVFQAPASPGNPMFEQWHYINRTGQHVHYVHNRAANAGLFDGHVALLEADTPLLLAFREAPLGRPPASLKVEIP